MLTIEIDSLGTDLRIVTKNLTFEWTGRNCNLIFWQEGVVLDAVRYIGYKQNRVRQIYPQLPYVFPPIGAQGLNLGLRDVAALSEALAGATDAGAPSVIADYDSARQTDVRLRTGAVDVLNRTLLTDLMPADLMRGAGLLALSRIGPLRRLVMRQGLAGGARA